MSQHGLVFCWEGEWAHKQGVDPHSGNWGQRKDHFMHPWSTEEEEEVQAASGG